MKVKMSFANGNDRLAMGFGVMQFGGAGVGLPPGGSVGQFLRKNSATDYDASWLDGDVFWATYNETSYADIKAAYDAGKTVLLLHPDNIILPLKQFGHDDWLEADFVEFYGVVGFANPYVYYARCDASEDFWTRSRMLLATNSKIGNLGDLTTSAKNSVVSAINEVNGKTGGVVIDIGDTLATLIIAAANASSSQSGEATILSTISDPELVSPYAEIVQTVAANISRGRNVVFRHSVFGVNYNCPVVSYGNGVVGMTVMTQTMSKADTIHIVMAYREATSYSAASVDIFVTYTQCAATIV